MSKLLEKIAGNFEKRPFKSIFIALIIFIVMITGALKMEMSTGNETLVQTDSEAYMSNFRMEDEFGGDAVIVLFEGQKDELLSIDNMEKIWNLEDRLKYNDSIFSIMSPANIIHQITDKQAETIKEQVPTIADGLGEMGSKLEELSQELGGKELPNPDSLDEKMDSLMSSMDPNRLLADMGASKEAELKDKFSQMSAGLAEMGGKLETIGHELLAKELPDLEVLKGKITDLSNQLKNLPGQDNIANKLNTEFQEIEANLQGDSINPDELKTMANGLISMGENLNNLSDNIKDMAADSLLAGDHDMLADMTSNIQSELDSMKDIFDLDLSPEDFQDMADGFLTMSENLLDLSEGLDTFHSKSGMLVANFPHNQKELDEILYEDGELREVFEDTIIDENHLVMMIKLEGNIDDSKIDELYEAVQIAADSQDFSVNYIISGKPVLDSSLRVEMKSNMIKMVVSAVLLMFIILSLVFRVRWNLLSLGIVFVSVVATIGLMGHLDVSMTMVSMAVFPILIGLGIDYSIQLHNRYEEEKSVTITLTQIGRAVGLAVLATMLGFVSLYASPVPMIQDFGKMLTIGVLVSFIGSVFLLMPILKARDLVVSKSDKAKAVEEEKERFIERFLSKLSRLVTRFSLVIVILAISFAVAGIIADQKVGVETDVETFMPQDMAALHDIHYARDIIGSTNQIVLHIEEDNILSEANLDTIRKLVTEIESKFSKEIVDVKWLDNLVSNAADSSDISHSEYLDIVEDIPASQSKMFLNEDRNKSLVIMNVEHMSTEDLQDFVLGIRETIEPYPLEISLAGKSVLDAEMVKGLTDGRIKMTILGLALVFLALLILYRSFFKAAVAVFPVTLIVGMSGGIMLLLGLKYTPITATLGALILGMGTEMTIMVLERYLEERGLGHDKRESMDITLRNIGKATLASGLTTIGGFSVLMTSKFEILKDFGLMTVINISLALISTFVILPALIWIFDKYIVREKDLVTK